MRPFPRATADEVVLAKEVWNRLVETVESLAKLAVSPPLELSQSAAGRTLSLRPSAAATAVVVEVTGNASGGGCYTGRILTGTATADGSSNLSMPAGMTVPAADDAVILNLAENGKATHDLSSGRFTHGIVVGKTAAGKRVVAVDAVEFADCPTS